MALRLDEDSRLIVPGAQLHADHADGEVEQRVRWVTGALGRRISAAEAAKLALGERANLPSTETLVEALAAFDDVAAHAALVLLRAWERRYGLLRPERSSGGYRLYSAEER